LIVIDAIELDGLQFTLEQNINKVNLTQLLSNVEKQDENNISASAKTVISERNFGHNICRLDWQKK
jgi:hypothetical protein